MAKKSNIIPWVLAGLGLLGLGVAVAASIDVEQEIDNQFASAGVSKFRGWRCFVIILYALGYNTPSKLQAVPSQVAVSVFMKLSRATLIMRSFGLTSPVALLLIWGIIVSRRSADIWNTAAVKNVIAQFKYAKGGLLGASPQQLESAAVISLCQVLASSSASDREKVFLSQVQAYAKTNPALSGPLLYGWTPVPDIDAGLFDTLIRPKLKIAQYEADTMPTATDAYRSIRSATYPESYPDDFAYTGYDEPAPSIDYGDINSPGGWDQGYGYMNAGGQDWGFDDVGDAVLAQNPLYDIQPRR